MDLRRRLAATLSLIVASLLPRRATSPASDISGTPDGFVIPPEQIPSHLTAISHLTTKSRSASLIFPGVFPVAAPFLLFRLKRLGFTARVECGDGDFRLIVRR